jgi:outer membrane protein OmpA-like peptidoglycan-associated protein
MFITPSTVQAQLKPWDHSNQVLVDLSILDEISGLGGFASHVGISGLPKPKNLARRLSNISNPSSQLLSPPKKTPVSSFLINRASKIKAAKKIKRLSFKSTSPRNYNKRTAISKRKLAAIKRKAPSSKQTTKNNPKPVTPKISDFALKQQNVKAGEMPRPPTILPAPPPSKNVSKLTPTPNEGTLKQAAPVVSKPQEIQQAALPQAVASKNSVNVVFTPGGSELSSSARKALDLIATELNSKKDVRMQLMAYAGENKMAASKARRLSLSRALAVRSYLIEKGVRGTRIDVRALGNKVSSGLPNRVDLRVIGQ